MAGRDWEFNVDLKSGLRIRYWGRHGLGRDQTRGVTKGGRGEHQGEGGLAINSESMHYSLGSQFSNSQTMN